MGVSYRGSNLVCFLLFPFTPTSPPQKKKSSLKQDRPVLLRHENALHFVQRGVAPNLVRPNRGDEEFGWEQKIWVAPSQPLSFLAF